jgi:hypothetical protein
MAVLRGQVVSLRRCTKVTDVGVAALSLSGKLRSLSMAGIPNVGHAALKALSTSCRCELPLRGTTAKCPKCPRPYALCGACPSW